MDLFGTKRKRAHQAGVDAMRPMIGILQHFSGLPPRFWSDEFVLGYTMTIAGLAARMVSPDLDTTQKGQVITDVFGTLSNQNGQAIVRHVIELTQQPTPAFTLGADNAVISFAYTFRRLRDEDDNPHVIAAKEVASAMGKDEDRDAIGGVLMEKLFHQVIRDRFDMDGSNKQRVRESADEIEKACKWIVPAVFAMPLDQFIQMSKQHRAVESYIDKNEYGFIVGGRDLSYRVTYGGSLHGLTVEGHNDFFGLFLAAFRDQPVNVSLKDTLSPKGGHAEELKVELLKRSGFHSTQDFMKQ